MNTVGAIRKLLIDEVTVTSLLADNTSVYPVVIPQGNASPAIALMVADTKPNDSKTQVSGQDNVQVLVNIFAASYDRAQQIDTAVRIVIDGFTGGVTTSDATEHYIDSIRFLNRKDDYDEENRLFIRQCVYDVRYYRDIPEFPFGTPYQAISARWPMWNNDDDAAAGGTDERGNVVDPVPVGGFYLTGPDCDFLPYGVIKFIMA